MESICGDVETKGNKVGQQGGRKWRDGKSAIKFDDMLLCTALL